MEKVLVFPTAALAGLCGGEPFQGVRTGDWARHALDQLFAEGNLHYRLREEAEQNPDFKQVIPYCVLRSGGLYFRYRRTKKGGESRLHERWSVGLGGHINPYDGDETFIAYEMGFFREMAEETGLLFKSDKVARASIVGLINDDSDAVGRVHFGVVHVVDVPPDKTVELRDPAVQAGYYCSLEVLQEDEASLENWSRLVVREILPRLPT